MKKFIAFCLALTLFTIVANAQTQKRVVIRKNTAKSKILVAMKKNDAKQKLQATKVNAKKEGE